MFYFLKNKTKLTGKHLCQSLFFQCSRRPEACLPVNFGIFKNTFYYHSMHWGINPPSKTPPPSFLPTPPLPPSPPLKLTNCPSPLPFRQSPFLYWFFVNPPSLKVGFLSEPPKCKSFPSLIPSYLLKVTKF